MNLNDLADDITLTIVANLTEIANHGYGDITITHPETGEQVPVPQAANFTLRMTAIEQLFALQNNLRNHINVREETIKAPQVPAV